MASRKHDFGGKIRNSGGVDLRDNNSACSSSTSSEGSITLHGESPTEARPSDDPARMTSPISSPINDLSIITNKRFWKAGGHFVPDSPDSALQSSPLPPRDPSSILRPPRNGLAPYSGGGGYRSSRTWVSPDAQHNQEFLMTRNSMRRLFKHSDVAKWKLQDFIAHREAMIASKKAALAKSLEEKEHERKLQLQTVQVDPTKMVGSLVKLSGAQNLAMEGNISRVLGVKTIWCIDWMNGKDEIAPWPSFAEMKWEGDDRAKTNCGRFLPLPRELGPPNIQWGQLQVIEQYPLDQVQCIPTMEDVYLPVDQIEEEDISNLLNTDLLNSIDEFLES
ncbi:hypothetical protein N0V90_005577 [Kalmusia sp. IMI 367209]|nr:hypothetical protein N0V90_005577 [Kalmusia sp. IMI 367209]